MGYGYARKGHQETQVARKWERQRKALKVIIPPFNWLFGDEELSDAARKHNPGSTEADSDADFDIKG